MEFETVLKSVIQNDLTASFLDLPEFKVVNVTLLNDELKVLKLSIPFIDSLVAISQSVSKILQTSLENWTSNKTKRDSFFITTNYIPVVVV